MRKYLGTTLKVVFAAGIIFWMVQSGKIDFRTLPGILHPVYLPLAILLMFVNAMAMAHRWKILVNAQGLEMKFWDALKLFLVGVFFNFAMPGGVGGDVVKGYYMTRKRPDRKVDAALSVLMDRIMGLYAMILMAAVMMLLDFPKVRETPGLSFLFLMSLGLAVGATVFLLLAFSPQVRGLEKIWRRVQEYKIGRALFKVYISIHVYGKHPQVLLKTILWSWVAQTTAILFFVNVGAAFQMTEIPLIAYFFVCPLGFMITAIPISPAGVGMGQAAFYYLFNLYTGAQSDFGSNAITLMQIFQFIVGFAGAFFYLRMKKEK
ncbi:MAG: lysylphosphatidylglycerol synthase transmembrane domain-containing protein [Pseudobdellovibrionaceae bacterium]